LQAKLKSVVDPQEQLAASQPDIDGLPVIERGRNKAISLEAIRAILPVDLTLGGR
jgi:hypothetical protein